MQLLQERLQRSDRWISDYIADLVCCRLANLRDPKLIGEAIMLDDSFGGETALKWGLANPAGREFLLERIANTKEPLKERIRFAQCLDGVGCNYNTTCTNITNHSCSQEGSTSKGNAGFIARIARLAVHNSGNEELSRELIRAIDYSALGIRQGKDDDLKKDLTAALSILKLCDSKASEKEKYEVELTIAHGDRETYDKLGSKCGPILSILMPVDPKKYTKPAEKSLPFEFKINTLDAMPLPRPMVVLANQDTGQTYVLESKISDHLLPHVQEGRPSSMGGSDQVALPDDLPHGTYRAYYQFSRDGEVISVGHYFESKL